tara:strand:+ start:6690 stop:7322 length:633 start_codon:yes stop_codon:yes gene_type:complete
MKKLILLIFIFFFTGCFWKNSGEPEKQAEIQETGVGTLKVQVSPHVPSMVSKRLGVIPFTGVEEDLGLFLSTAIADNLVISGLQVIEPKFLVAQLEKSLAVKESFHDSITDEWEEFKKFFEIQDRRILISNLTELKELDIVDFLLIGRLNIKKKWFFFKSNEINTAYLDIVDVQNGVIIYSLIYSRDEEEETTPLELSEKFSKALITAMQ